MMHARIVALLAVIFVGTPEGRLLSQEPMTECYDWSVDPNAMAVGNVVLPDFKYLPIDEVLEVIPYRDRVRSTRSVRILIKSLEKAAATEGESVLIAVEDSAAPPRRGLLVRLGTKTVAVDADTGKPLEFVRFWLATDIRPTDIGDGIFDALDCAEVPGVESLIPLESMAALEERRLIPPRSLEDIGKTDDGAIVAIPVDPAVDPARRLSEIGRGDGGLSDLSREDKRPLLEELAELNEDPAPDSTEETDSSKEPETLLPPPEEFVEKSVEPLPESGIEPAPLPQGAICDLYGNKLVVAPGLIAAPYLTVGQRSSVQDVDLWTYNDVVDQVLPSDDSGTLTAEPGTVEPVTIVRTYRAADEPIQHVLRPILPDSLRLVSAEPIDALPVVLTVRVFGDARMVAISALEGLDDDLAGLLPDGTLKVLWHEVEPEGRIGTLREFGSFADLVKQAQDLPVSDISYSKTSTMQTFAEGMARSLTNSEETTDLAIWILEGVILPDETPAILSEMISQVGRDGNIRRFLPGDGRPRRWLHLVAGQFAQSFSESYIRGPVLRADPPIGEVDVELDSGKADRSLLEDRGKLSLALSNSIKRNLASLELPDMPAGKLPPDTYLVGKKGYEKIGILLPADQATDWLDAAAQTLLAISRFQDASLSKEIVKARLDLSALLLVRSSSTGLVAGLEGTVGNEEQRLSRLEIIGLLDDYQVLLEQLTVQLGLARSLSREECGYAFMELSD